MTINTEFNEVEHYLKENIGKKLALRTIYRNLKIKRRKAIWLINQSTNIKKLTSHEVGSGKSNIHIYTYM